MLMDVLDTRFGLGHVDSEACCSSETCSSVPDLQRRDKPHVAPNMDHDDFLSPPQEPHKNGPKLS